MKIKYRITLLFLAVVMCILLLLCFSIFYLSNITRQQHFVDKLKKSGLTTAGLLTKVQGVDKNLLRRIDEENKTVLFQKCVIIYDQGQNEMYEYFDENTIPLNVTLKVLKKLDNKKDYYYKVGKIEVLVFQYTYNTKKFYVVSAAYDKDGFEQLSKLKLVLFISFIIGTILSIVTGIIFSISLISPINNIAEDIKDISSQNLTRRIKINEDEPDNELNNLSITLNDLIDRLQQSFETQSRFIANASHELSTPLMSISGQLEISLQKDRSITEYKDVIKSVYEDVKILIQLTKSLLEIANANGTIKGTELNKVRIDELIMRIPSELKTINNNYKVNINFLNFPDNEEELNVFGNSELLYSAYRNVIINGCKYSYNYIAEVSLFFTKSEIVTIVENEGEIIKKEDEQLIFEPFFRSTNINDTQGFGLGLSLAKKILKIHKGDISYTQKSESINSFRIVVPTKLGDEITIN